MRQDVSKRTMDNLKKKYQASFRRWLVGQGGGGTIAPYVGHNLIFVRNWIESRHLVGMTWGTYGEIWVVDHIVPLRLFDMTNEEELRVALHYKNLMPLYKQDNMCKDGAIEFSMLVLERVPYCGVVAKLKEKLLQENKRLNKYLGFYVTNAPD
jgi:hypothetical protein